MCQSVAPVSFLQAILLYVGDHVTLARKRLGFSVESVCRTLTYAIFMQNGTQHDVPVHFLPMVWYTKHCWWLSDDD